MDNDNEELTEKEKFIEVAVILLAVLMMIGFYTKILFL